jgi:hypothetical protein
MYVNGLVGVIALVALAALVAWLVGSIVLRLVGGLLIVVGLFGTISAGDVLGLIVMLTLGLAGWLAGHWLFAFRHHYYAGAIAERVFLQVMPARLDPTRRWWFPNQ